MNYVYGLLSLVGLAITTLLFVGFCRHLWRLPLVEQAVERMEEGVYVKHGFVFDSETGRAIPSKSPSTFARTHLDTSKTPTN
jgi:hypothetical protein